MIKRILLLLVLTVALSADAIDAFSDNGDCPGLTACAVDQNNATVGMSRAEVLGLPKSPADSAVEPAASMPRFEYGSTTACSSGAKPGEQGADTMCLGAVVACRGGASGP